MPRDPGTKSDTPIRVGVDIGGTFTDVALERGGQRFTAKVLTTPAAQERAVLDGLRRVLEAAHCDASAVSLIIHGTTLATNALIERKGARTALLTTEGFRDVLEMGTESRFEQYDLNMQKPSPLVPRRHRFTVAERLSADGEVLIPLDQGALADIAERLARESIESLAIGFMHSFRNATHERRAAELIAARLPGLALSLSSEVSPEIREYERFSTTCANAYVQPLIAGYLDRLERALAAAGFRCPLFMMLSSGGITEPQVAKRFPVRLVESGPAGGAILACELARQCGLGEIVAFDMGGTTAKICLIEQARPQLARSLEVARMYRFKAGSGLPLRIPVIEMVEIGAGGGSIASVDTLKRIRVGPQSAGSEPGPACYDRGGRGATVTDADLILGRIDPHEFAGGRIALDAAKAAQALDENVGRVLGHGPAFAAFGVSEMVDENMANAAREHASENGKSMTGRTMIAFGGSAPLHAARLAEKLGIARIVIPRSAGVGSAVGFLRAAVSYEVSRSAHQRLDRFDAALVNELFAEMTAEARAVVERAAPGCELKVQRQAHMRYVGQGHEIPVALPQRALDAVQLDGIHAAFESSYREKYARTIPGVPIEVMSWTVSVTAPAPPAASAPARPPAYAPAASARRRSFDPENNAYVEVPVYHRESLRPGAHIAGPALITEDETTSVVRRSFCAWIDPCGHIVMDRLEEGRSA